MLIVPKIAVGFFSAIFALGSVFVYVHCQSEIPPPLGCHEVATKLKNSIDQDIHGPGRCGHWNAVDGLFLPRAPRPRYLITGGAGFIGSHLVKALLAQPNTHPSQLVVLDNFWRGSPTNLQYDNGSWSIDLKKQFCFMDLRSQKATMHFIRGADYIYHLADVVAGIGYVFNHQARLFHNNILINTNVLTATHLNGIPNYIYVGTACSFPEELQMGPGVHALSENQTYPAHPESSYGWSKLMGEYEAELMRVSSQIANVSILRLHNVYGPRSVSDLNSGQVIPALLLKAINYPKDGFTVWGSGKQYRDFIFVDDVVQALILIKDKGVNKGVIQIGSESATTVAELSIIVTKIAEKKLGKKIKVMFDTSKPEGDRGRISINDRARSILGWKPLVSLQDGLEKTFDWMIQSQKTPKVLVINIGQPRGGELAWKSFHKHVIRPYHATSITLFTDAPYLNHTENNTSLLEDMAQFSWRVPEYCDWGYVFDQAASTCRSHELARDWFRICELKDQFLGGIVGCGHKAGSGLLLSFRYIISQKLVSMNLIDKYDVFVLTRSDELYLCDHYDFRTMMSDSSKGYVTTGEGYGGYSDRHLFATRNIFLKMISITEQMACQPEYAYALIKKHNSNRNLETIQRIFFEAMNISIISNNRSQFTVKTYEDTSRWSTGKHYMDNIFSQYEILPKYIAEIPLARNFCGLVTESSFNAKLEDLKSYDWKK
jgi:nucleoside-diphosphate-sugar epimerase